MAKRIYIKDWLELKPYSKQTPTDSYYLTICNNVRTAISRSPRLHGLSEYLSDKDIVLLACFLTSYFEDLTSETNIWNSFVRVHKRMYGKNLPFYSLDEYYDEEINTADIALLIWYFLNTMQEVKFISPFNEYILDLAEVVIEVFEAEWEFAPPNVRLKSFYQIDEHEENYYVAREFLDIILFQTYLFYPDTSRIMTSLQLEILHESMDDPNLTTMINEATHDIRSNSHTRLLSLKGKDWAAEILGAAHPLSEHFSSISQRVNGYFLYKGQDNTDVFIEHIASGKEFKMTKKSYDYSHELEEIDSIIFLGIVRWMGEWWFSGISILQPFNANLILEEKNSIESRMSVNFLNYPNKDIAEMIALQSAAFKKCNNGSLIAFLPAEKIESFIRAFREYYNGSLNLSEKEKIASDNRMREVGFFGVKDEAIDYSEISESGLVFFDTTGGIEVVMDINSAFPLPNNPFIKIADSERAVLSLFMSEDVSTDLAYYCIEHCKDNLPLFEEGFTQLYLKDIDFLFRFWKKGNYHSEPAVHLMG